MNYPNRVIKKGDSNKAVVKALQQILNEVGCGPIDVDGDFGPNTFKAVKHFQATRRDQNGNPLEIDGKVKSKDWILLFGNKIAVTAIAPPNDLFRKAFKYASSQKNEIKTDSSERADTPEVKVSLGNRKKYKI